MTAIERHHDKDGERRERRGLSRVAPDAKSKNRSANRANNKLACDRRSNAELFEMIGARRPFP